MKSMQRILALVIVAALSAAMLAGCAGSGTGTNTTTAASGSTAAATDRDLYEFTMLGNLVTEMKEWDTAYIKGLEDALNLKITVELPPSTSYSERLQMMLASGEYAELSLFPNHTDKMFVDAVKNGVFIPLNSYLENAPNLMEYSYDISWETLKILGDDNIYAIPRTSIARADGYLIRKDWLDAVGYTDFKEGEYMTLAQMEEIATLFTTGDPDGNGAADTFGITSNSDDLGNIDVLFGPSFGLTGWKEYDGEYMDPKWSQTMDNYKNALAWSNKVWEAGIVDPDWPTIKRDISLDRFKKGVVGVVGEFAGWLTSTQDQARELNPEAELAYVIGLVENEGDKYTAGAFSTGFWGEWVIANTAEKPERIVEMLDYILSDEYWNDTNYGPKGITWTEENGVVTPTDQYTQTLVGRSILRRNNDPGFFVSLAQSAEARTRFETLIALCTSNMNLPTTAAIARPSPTIPPSLITRRT